MTDRRCDCAQSQQGACLGFVAPELLRELAQTSGTRPDGGEVDVWGFALEASSNSIAQLESLLAADEQARAMRLVRPQDRERFVVAHAATRLILAGYTGIAPAAIGFTQSAHGKPHLDSTAGGCAGLTFSLSHSHDRGLLAVARSNSVGADLERVRDNVDALRIAERFFSADERAILASVRQAAQVETFFRYWVAKEAVLKAAGVGLMLPTDRFTVSFSGDEASVRAHGVALLEIYTRARMLRVDAGWCAAVCAPARHWHLRLRTPA